MHREKMAKKKSGNITAIFNSSKGRDGKGNGV